MELDPLEFLIEIRLQAIVLLAEGLDLPTQVRDLGERGAVGPGAISPDDGPAAASYDRGIGAWAGGGGE